VTLTAGVAVPRRAAGVELLGAMPGSGYRQPPALVRRADGQTITLTRLLHLTLQAVDGRRDYAEVAAILSGRITKTATAEDVEYLVEQKLRPLGLVLTGTDPEPTTRKANPLLALRLKVVVTDPALTRRLTAPFAWLFRPVVALPLIVAFALASWWILVDKGLASATHQAFYEPGMLLLVWALVLLSAGFHEIGHASACRYGGATPGVMGAGLYLVWPAFYTEVTDSYRLGRSGRLRVDLGGLYFNAIFAIATMGVWIVQRSDALLLVVAAQHLQMVRQLAPFIRADGYHIIADLTGVPDLYAHIKPTLLSLLPTRWGGRRHATLKPWARSVVSAWVLVVVPLLLTLLAGAVHLLPRLAATAWDSMGQQWHAATIYWGEGDLPAATVRGLSVLIIALPVLGLVYLLLRITRRVAVHVWSITSGRPASRGCAVLGLAAVIGLVAWSWWPAERYQPIRADEGGRITQVVDAIGSVAPPRPPTYPPSGTDSGAPEPAALVPPPQVAPRAPTQPATVPEHAAPSFSVVEHPDPTEPAPPAAAVPATVVVAEVPGEGTWVFPFPAPPPPGDGDNRATSVNTEDGRLLTALSIALAVVDGSEQVDQRNEAFAFASCTDCTTVAVAFQALLVVGQADVITPVNTAVAANYDCLRCQTASLASQLVVSLTRMPSDEARQKVDAALARLRALEPQLATMTVSQIYQVLTATKAEILQALVADGALPTVLTDLTNQDTTSAPSSPNAVPTTPAPAPSPTESSSLGSSEPASPSSGPTDETVGETPSGTPSGTPSEAAPTPSPSPTPSPTPTPSPSPSPSPDPATPSSDPSGSATASPQPSMLP
jgi:putative peptide zinc metalloprotease protein